MQSRCTLLLLLVLAFAIALSAEQQEDEQVSEKPKGLISGTVIRHDTKSPLAEVSVTLRGLNASSGDAVVYTGSDGKFSFSDLPAGTYSLIAGRPRFTMLSDNLQKVGALFTIGKDQKIKDIVLTLVPGGVVYGKVFDDSGEPLVGATVALVRPKYSRSRTLFTAADSAPVNDLGEFRIFGIPPGRYYLVAIPPGANTEQWERNRTDREARPTNYRRVFYDNALAETDARPLQITAGSETSVSFRLSKVATATVRINLTIPKTFGEFSGYAGMIPIDSLMFDALDYATINFNKVSTVFNGVIPGRYYAGAIIEIDSSSTKEKAALSIQEFDISEGINEIQVPVTHLGVSAIGQLRFDSDTHPPAEDFSIRLFTLRGDFTLFDDGDGDSVAGSIEVEPNGDFKLGALSRQRTAFQLKTKSASDRYYLKSVLVGGKEALTTGILLSEAGARIELLVASDGGIISGVVMDATGHPIHNSTVVALPDAEHRKTYSCISSDSTDSTGRFSLTGICPGQYTLLALPLEAPAGIYWDPEFVDSHLQSGLPVEVKPNSIQKVELSPIKLD